MYFSGGFVPIDELLRAIAGADVGVVAMKRDAFRDLTLCNKMYDFITMRRPAVVDWFAIEASLTTVQLAALASPKSKRHICPPVSPT